MRMISTGEAEASNDDIALSNEEPAENCDIDLFGDEVVEPAETRGRPSFLVTEELQEKVSVLAGAGFDRDQIANVIGCSEKTLRTLFLPELNQGGDCKRAEIVLAVFEKAKSGNVAAAKAYLAGGEMAAAVMPSEAPKKDEDAPVEKLGKKAQEIVDAGAFEVDSTWGTLMDAVDAVQ